MVDAKVLTDGDLANYLRVHRSTIYRLLKRRELPAFRVGSDWRFNIEMIDEWRRNVRLRNWRLIHIFRLSFV
jgi:excisionase family DNA binding protein